MRSALAANWCRRRDLDARSGRPQSVRARGGPRRETTISKLKAPIVAGGANNQLATPEDGHRLHERKSCTRQTMSLMPGESSTSAPNISATATRPWFAANRGHPVAARADLARGLGDGPRSGNGCGCYGAKADRQGISRPCTRSPIPPGSFGSPDRRRPGWFLLASYLPFLE